MARIVREVQPRFVFVENSPMLTSRGLGRVLGDLAAMGFDAEWGVVSAADVGAPHKRDRIWIMGYAHNDGQIAAEIIRGAIERSNGSQARSEQALESSGSSEQYAKLAETNMSQRERTELTDSYAHGQRQLQPQRLEQDQRGRVGNVCSEVPDAHKEKPARLRSGTPAEHSEHRSSSECLGGNQGWPPEPGLGRVVDGMADDMDRIAALGNGQVPSVAALAWRILSSHTPDVVEMEKTDFRDPAK